jgi:ParB-like chromosome segregation protein Spo0J
MDYKEHSLAALFPLMEGSAFDELVADIRENGQRAPATLCDGKLLDGRNRVRACEIIGIEPKYRSLNGEDPLAYVLSVNFHRRHLNESQRALIAAKAADMSKGRPKLNAPRGAFKPPLLKPSQQKQGVSQSEAATFAGVSRRSVQRASEVLRDAPPKEIAKIASGKKTVTEVARETKKKAETKKPHLDKTGYVIPESILPDWERAEQIGRDWLSRISSLRTELKSHLDDQDLIVASVTNTTLADLNNAYTSVKCVVPHAVCTSCQGHQRKKCNLCKGRGFLDDFAWRSFVAPELKAMREKSK